MALGKCDSRYRGWSAYPQVAEHPVWKVRQGVKKAFGIILIVLGVVVSLFIGITKGLVIGVIGIVLLSPKLLDKLAAKS